MAASSARPSQTRPSSSGGATQDLDYFVEVSEQLLRACALMFNGDDDGEDVGWFCVQCTASGGSSATTDDQESTSWYDFSLHHYSVCNTCMCMCACQGDAPAPVQVEKFINAQHTLVSAIDIDGDCYHLLSAVKKGWS